MKVLANPLKAYPLSLWGYQAVGLSATALACSNESGPNCSSATLHASPHVQLYAMRGNPAGMPRSILLQDLEEV